MGKKDFESFLKKQELEKKDETTVDWEKEKKGWLEYLNQFYELIENFLTSYVERKKISLTFNTEFLFEENIGEYEVKSLSLTIGNQKIYFKPIGTLLIGAKGRVDMEGPVGTIKFVLVDKESTGISIRVKIYEGGKIPTEEKETNKKINWVWKIATPPPSIKYIELNENSFFDALMSVING